MIRLTVADYCQNCPYFEPEVEKIETFDMSFINTSITCKDRVKCEQIHNHLKEEFKIRRSI